MDYGICMISVAPLRSLPADTSEMVTQVLFGELVRVLDRQDKWLYVQLETDNYQGWISKGQLTPLSKADYTLLQDQARWVSTDLVQVLHNKTKDYRFLISAGSSFYNCMNDSFELLGDSYQYLGTMSSTETFLPDALINNAMLFLHTPYVWGGKSALGIDCSGLTQLIFKMAGKTIHRDASQQATQGEMINLINEALAGDLLFFDNEEGHIIHTGVLIDDVHILHAHQKVRIDKVDHHGIFNLDTKKYSHKLRVIKRM